MKRFVRIIFGCFCLISTRKRWASTMRQNKAQLLRSPKRLNWDFDAKEKNCWWENWSNIHSSSLVFVAFEVSGAGIKPLSPLKLSQECTALMGDNFFLITSSGHVLYDARSPRYRELLVRKTQRFISQFSLRYSTAHPSRVVFSRSHWSSQKREFAENFPS